MRILLAHNSLFYPSHGGGDKSNRLLMEALAANGHAVRVVARIDHFGEAAHRQLAADLAERDVPFEESAELIRFERNGVDVRTLTRSAHLRAYFAAQIAEFDPDIILTSTDDPAQLLFDLAIRQARARVVYLIRATIAAPFGPDSSMPNPQRAALLKQADGAVGVSEYVADYARRWGGLNAVHVPISLMEPGATDALGRFGNPYVTMVNPCAVKGIAIFLELAACLPYLRFAAVPTWGTTPDDQEDLARHPNIEVLPPADRIDEILHQTRVMLVPSLWAEARSRMVMEAMLRGIPVMASNVGGLREAKLGVPYLLPVNPISQYRASVDLNMVPLADVPRQDIAPWRDALTRLTSSEDHWQTIASGSRAAALRYLETLTSSPFEAYLEELRRQPKKPPLALALSDDKKRLLALRMKQRAQPNWFPRCTTGPQPRLFCFPHAGAGTLAFRDWHLSGYAVCPVLLPGREDRASEMPFDRMADLSAALVHAIEPFLTPLDVFFGHSMGAGLAFELVRALRRMGRVCPRLLVVSGARAPQYRLLRAEQPELADEELTAQIRALGGTPDHLIPLAVPTLRADLRLYRNYAYTDEAPLGLPIVAYCGDSDPNVSNSQMAEWKTQTTAQFLQRTFPGGHFYLREHLPLVLAALARDIAAKDIAIGETAKDLNPVSL